jgi:pimeloyl-ACP methyl ester carboxylesterase
LNPPARLRRTYFDCRYGQLHVHQAIPPGGGFDEATPLLCVPGAEGLGRWFEALMAPLGADRSIYAPDLPGRGMSDSAGAGAGASEYATALIDMLDSLRQRRVDVLCVGEGAHTALALVAQRPAGLVRRLVFYAAPAPLLAEARRLQLEFRELPLAAAAESVLPASLLSTQLNDLISFFGPDRNM